MNFAEHADTMILKPSEDKLFPKERPEIDYEFLDDCTITYSDNELKHEFNDFKELRLKY